MLLVLHHITILQIQSLHIRFVILLRREREIVRVKETSLFNVAYEENESLSGVAQLQMHASTML